MPVADTGHVPMTEFFDAAIDRFCRRESDKFFSDESLSESLTYDEWNTQVCMAAVMFESLLEQGKPLWEAESLSLEELKAGTFSIGMTMKAIAVLASLAGVDVTRDSSRRTNGEME